MAAVRPLQDRPTYLKITCFILILNARANLLGDMFFEPETNKESQSIIVHIPIPGSMTNIFWGNLSETSRTLASALDILQWSKQYSQCYIRVSCLLVRGSMLGKKLPSLGFSWDLAFRVGKPPIW